MLSNVDINFSVEEERTDVILSFNKEGLLKFYDQLKDIVEKDYRASTSYYKDRNNYKKVISLMVKNIDQGKGV